MNKKTKIIAHRGASAYKPENTMQAFVHAWALGADGVEADFHLSQDKKLICVHDEIVFDENGQALKIGDYDSSFWEGKSVSLRRANKTIDVTLCSLRTVLACIPAQKEIFIEIKSDEDSVPPLIEEIGNSPLSPAQVVVISFQKEVIRDLKKLRPDIRGLWIVDFSFTDGQPIPSLDSVLETLQKIGADGLSSNCHPKIDESLVQQLRKRNYLYNVWTVDEPDRAEQFLSLQTDSISTNKPDWLRELRSSKSR